MMHSTDAVYLHPRTKIEPHICGWYAWPHLLAPAQLAMNLKFRLVPLMHSFITNPAAHLAASSDPKMYGGPFVSLPMQDVPGVERLLADIQRRCARLLTFAEDFKDFAAAVEAEASGFSLNDFYARLPPSLAGLVECVYDLDDHAQVRLFEDLLYGDELASGTQEICMQSVGEQDRHFFMSTPRLDYGTSRRFVMDFSDGRLDVLARMRYAAKPFDEVADLFSIEPADAAAFRQFFTTTPPAMNGTPHYTGPGVRMRYFGHACVLFQTERTAVLIDPMVAFESNGDGRFTCNDLPERIDYVVLTHSHQDHFSAEILLQLRHRIGRIVVPGNNHGSLADPSMKLILRSLGFAHIDVLEPGDRIGIDGGELLSLPFTGEHGDLNIYSKHSIALTLAGRKVLLLVDSDGIDPMLFRRMMRKVGAVDALFLGMECHGAPLGWLYEPLLGRPASRKNNESRRLSGCNCERAWQAVTEIEPARVFVYAMGQEPWMQYVMGLQYQPDSIQLLESDRFLQQCRRASIDAERLYCSRQIEL